MSNIKQLHEAFWEYAGNTKGDYTMEDVFAGWANDSGVTLEEASETWKLASAEVEDYIRTADISISGDVTEIEELLKGKNPGSAPMDLNIPKVEKPKGPGMPPAGPMAGPMAGPKPPMGPPMPGQAGPPPTPPTPPTAGAAPEAPEKSVLDELE